VLSLTCFNFRFLSGSLYGNSRKTAYESFARSLNREEKAFLPTSLNS
jgi:hypothetical protein